MFARAIGDYPFLAPFLRSNPTPRAADLAARTITLTTSELLNGAPWGAIEMLAGSLRAR